MKPNPYLIGKVPLFDPCITCLVKVVCNELCKPKILFDSVNPCKTKEIRIRTKRGGILCKNGSLENYGNKSETKI